MSWLQRITSDPAVCHGQPTVRGLRYPVETLLEPLSAGMTIEEILGDYPTSSVKMSSPRWSSARSPRVVAGWSLSAPHEVSCDAQPPARLARFLSAAGHDALHTADLPDGNRTTDGRIAELADDEGRVVVTKDRDLRDGHLLMRSSQRLLMIATGNVANTALLSLFEAHLAAIVTALDEADFVEVGPDSLVVHRRREDGPTH